MKIVFMGTPQFAVPSLRLLALSRHTILAVVTNPDRPSGRGRTLSAPPIKLTALELGLPVLQPASLREASFAAELANIGADLLVVVAFSILPKSVLRLAAAGAVNVHPSLLPAYRGAAPIIWSIINGETATGVTTFLLNPRVDAGDILMQRTVSIGPNETAGDLDERLREIGAELLVETLDGLEEGRLQPRAQGDTGATKAPKVSKQDGRIIWSRSATSVRNLIRGTNPVPGAFTEWTGGLLKVHAASLAPPGFSGEPGTVLSTDGGAGLLVVATGDGGALELTEVQPAGKSPMAAGAFLRGYPVTVGSRFGFGE